jgi:hypothetical protein
MLASCWRWWRMQKKTRAKEATCKKCGKRLTREEFIVLGIGPKCLKIIQQQKNRKPLFQIKKD